MDSAYKTPKVISDSDWTHRSTYHKESIYHERLNDLLLRMGSKTVEGHCNCGNIRIVVSERPETCVLCYCDNCRRSGGLSSVNFYLKQSDILVDDQVGVLHKYTDRNTTSGGIVERHFCGSCGSPVFSLVPAEPAIVYVKASLFEINDIPAPKAERYRKRKPQWMRPVNHVGVTGSVSRQ